MDSFGCLFRRKWNRKSSMRLLILSRYSRLGASSRLRTLSYLPVLVKSNFDVDVAPFFDDAYLSGLYAGKKATLATLGYFTSRLRRLLFEKRPDLIWIEKEAFPWLPWILEKAVLPRNVPFVADYDDAVFHRYDLHRSSVVRTLLGRKIDNVMEASALVLAGNRYLADRAVSAGAKTVEIIPTVVDVDMYFTAKRPAADKRPRIGWIGSPSTWTDYLLPLLPVLTASATKHDARIRAVGAPGTAKSGDRLEVLPWAEETEVPSIQGMDIGVMPLDDSPWAQGKCGYKLIQYMACGLPVVASPVGVNSQIVEHGVNGFLAQTDAEWARALDTLLGDAELRHRMGAAGRRKVERYYSLQVYGPRVAGLLMDVARSGWSGLR